MALTAVNENPWSSNLGVGSNTSPVFVNPNPIHKGSWGTSDIGLTESLKGQNNPVTVGGQINNNDWTSSAEAVNKMVSQGWDRTAAQQDIAAHPEKISQLLGGSGGTGGSPAPQAKTYTYNGKTTTTNNPNEVFNQLGLDSTDYSAWANQYNPDEFLKSIESEYGSQEGVFGQQENALKAALDSYNSIINADYEANLTKGKAAKESTAGQLAESKVTAAQKKQDALTAATKLYNELSQGYKQRFGGATSAGEASQSILGAEQQRQSGSIANTYATTVRDIQRQATDLENNYNAAVQELDVNKQKEVMQAQQNFQTNMTTISSNRALSLAAKEQAKRQVLLDMRNNLAAIEQSKIQYKQQLDLMNQQAKIQLDAQLKAQSASNTNYLNTANNAVNQIPTTITSNTTPSNTTATSNVMPSNTVTNSAGYIDPYNGVSKAKNWWEQ